MKTGVNLQNIFGATQTFQNLLQWSPCHSNWVVQTCRSWAQHAALIESFCSLCQTLGVQILGQAVGLHSSRFLCGNAAQGLSHRSGLRSLPPLDVASLKWLPKDSLGRLSMSFVDAGLILNLFVIQSLWTLTAHLLRWHRWPRFE